MGWVSYFFVLFCFVLFCFVLFCFVLFCFVFYFEVATLNNLEELKQQTGTVIERCLERGEEEDRIARLFHLHERFFFFFFFCSENNL